MQRGCGGGSVLLLLLLQSQVEWNADVRTRLATGATAASCVRRLGRFVSRHSDVVDFTAVAAVIWTPRQNNVSRTKLSQTQVLVGFSSVITSDQGTCITAELTQ